MEKRNIEREMDEDEDVRGSYNWIHIWREFLVD